MHINHHYFQGRGGAMVAKKYAESVFFSIIHCLIFVVRRHPFFCIFFIRRHSTKNLSFPMFSCKFVPTYFLAMSPHQIFLNKNVSLQNLSNFFWHDYPLELFLNVFFLENSFHCFSCAIISQDFLKNPPSQNLRPIQTKNGSSWHLLPKTVVPIYPKTAQNS